MAQEIERKFLVIGDGWKNADHTIEIRQGYLSSEKERTVRVRTSGNQGWLTIKGITTGISRPEFEYEVPVEEAREVLETLCQRPLIEKRRHLIEHAGFTWEVDEFFGVNEGLIVAEIELIDKDQPFKKPDWLGEEVSNDPRFFNANLIAHPYTDWEATPQAIL